MVGKVKLGLDINETKLTKEENAIVGFVVMVGVAMVNMVGVMTLVSWYFDTMIGFKYKRNVWERSREWKEKGVNRAHNIFLHIYIYIYKLVIIYDEL